MGAGQESGLGHGGQKTPFSKDLWQDRCTCRLGGGGAGERVRVTSAQPQAGLGLCHWIQIFQSGDPNVNSRASHPSSWRQRKGANRETEKVSWGRHKERGECGCWKPGDGGASRGLGGAAHGQRGRTWRLSTGLAAGRALVPWAGAVWVARWGQQKPRGVRSE